LIRNLVYQVEWVSRVAVAGVTHAVNSDFFLKNKG